MGLSSLSHPFGWAQLCLLISSLLWESRKANEEVSLSTGMGDRICGAFFLIFFPLNQDHKQCRYSGLLVYKEREAGQQEWITQLL